VADLVDSLTRGNTVEVKTVLASVAFALAPGRNRVRRPIRGSYGDP
jgi:hypothetical protein